MEVGWGSLNEGGKKMVGKSEIHWFGAKNMFPMAAEESGGFNVRGGGGPFIGKDGHVGDTSAFEGPEDDPVGEMVLARGSGGGLGCWFLVIGVGA